MVPTTPLSSDFLSSPERKMPSQMVPSEVSARKMGTRTDI
jgi:hypothetical protein